MDGFSSITERHHPADCFVDAGELLSTLRQCAQFLDWEGESAIPEGPEEALIDYMAQHRGAVGNKALALLYTLRRIYGAGVARVRRQVDRYLRATERFVDIYGGGKIAIGRAPARINILGEHVDYVQYIPTEVLPFASREHDMLIIFRPSDEPVIRGATTLEGSEGIEFNISDFQCDSADSPQRFDALWLEALRRAGAPKKHWANYAKSGVYYCASKYPGCRIGFDFLIDSTIPAAGGASSSSTIVVLSGAAMRLANDIPFTSEKLALDSSKAEWYIGTRGGNMDHCAMCLSRRQHALHLNFTPFSANHVPLHRFRYRWITFFAHPADKGGDILLEYNERSAVSRLVIPALLQRMFASDPTLQGKWHDSIETLKRDGENITAAETIKRIVERLPESIGLDGVRRDMPEVFEEMERGYPLLCEAVGRKRLMVRSRALHHAGEVTRVRGAVRIFNEIFSTRMPEAPEKTEPGLRAVGDILTESHESLRDLYNLTTPDIDELFEIIVGHSGVYGARLMGGGFGGNILALVSKEHVAELVELSQRKYYRPRGRGALAESSVMVSTPGEGFGMISARSVFRDAAVSASAIWWKWDRYLPVLRDSICGLLDIPDISEFQPTRPVRPVIVAGARGEVFMNGGYRNPKALSELNGKTSLEYVLDALKSMAFDSLPPIIVTHPAAAKWMRANLTLPEGTILVEQSESLGTGHAVSAALNELAKDAENGTDVLVAWGSQPFLTSSTLTQSVMVLQVLGTAAMVFPTAVTRTPYAPIQRDLHGYVTASRETAAEGAPTKRLGETNVGAFVVGAATLIETIGIIRERLWDENGRRYSTISGEFGFPNEMARALAQAGREVIALPIASERESYGLRSVEYYERAKAILPERFTY